MNTSVIIIDLDYFKRINDKHGHLTGDKFQPIHGNDILALMKAADVALYAAKGAGRNRVVSAELGEATL